MNAKELGQQPAFPRNGFESDEVFIVAQEGMTKREHIVIEMMKALVANGRVPDNKSEVAQCAISYADELLAGALILRIYLPEQAQTTRRMPQISDASVLARFIHKQKYQMRT